MIGTLLGNRYEIIERIGSGGMAHVYKARCRLLNRDVAVKVLREELSENAEFLDRFKVEAQAAASLSHPNIVSVFDVGDERGIYYFVMEYIEGEPLKEYIQNRGALPYKEAVKIILQVMSAIEHAHKKCIIHRDIKPHNILINKEGIAKVTDFGIARAVSDATIVKGGSIIGSVHYFSPEQAKGMEVDYKSDIYSIGIVFYEMLTGRVPFEADSPFAVAKMQVEVMPPPPSEKNDLVPKSLDTVVLRAMAKDPNMRYPTVTAMMEDLNAFMENPETEPVEEAGDMYATRVVPVVNEDAGEQIKKNKKQKQDLTQEEKQENKTAVVWAWVTALVIILGVAAAIFAPKLFNGSTASNDLVVPNFEGQKLSDLKSKYKEDEFIFIEESRDYNDKYAEGYVITQSPKADEKYEKKPLEVKVTVSKGNKTITLDEYTGKKAEEVKKELENMGLTVILKTEKNDTYPIDIIIKTSPSKGSEMLSGDTITLFVSQGPDQATVKVPELAGMTEEAAKNAVRALGLVPDIKYQYSSTVAKGKFISQKPEASTLVQEKAVVTINISLGEEQVTAQPPTSRPTAAPTQKPTEDDTIVVKGYVGMPLEDARAAIEAAGFKVSVTYKQDTTYPKGAVSAQSPSQGTKASKGSVINLTVSNGGQQ